jgi:hypothetical protein
MSLGLALQLVGASLVALSLFHMVLSRSLGWNHEAARLSPLNARIFMVHAFFVAFVLLGLGLLSLMRPDLLLVQSDLGRLLLGGILLFWVARLLAQLLVFDGVMRTGWTGSLVLRAGAMLLWAIYVLVYGAAFLNQLRGLNL